MMKENKEQYLEVLCSQIRLETGELVDQTIVIYRENRGISDGNSPTNLRRTPDNV